MTRDLLRFVAAHGLPGQRPTPSPVTAATVGAVVAEAAVEKLTGLLDQAVADGAVEADAEAAERIGEEAVRTQAWALLVERHHLEVHDLLIEAGIETRFLKGPAVAHRFYEHPALRPFVDVDVLVRDTDLDGAIAVLMAHGHTRDEPELTPGFSARYGKSVTLRNPAAIEVDLHRVLASGPFGLVRPPVALWARPAHLLRLGNVDLPVLDPAAALVHAGVHAVTGRHARLGSLRDVAQMLHADDEAPELLASARTLAQELGVTACVAHAAAIARDALGTPLASLRILSAWPISRRDARWLDLYANRTSYTRLALASIPALHGVVPRLRYAAALLRARRAHRSAKST